MPECQCAGPDHSAPTIGTTLGNGLVGQWQALPGPVVEANTGLSERELKQCTCGCNTYSGTASNAPTDVDSLDIPALPIQLDYVDDDGPSDDHEYVSVKITELSDMVSAIRSCTCQDH
jgi:hypothetical protein